MLLRGEAGIGKTSLLRALPFPDAAFAAVSGFNSFQYAADPVAALREARRTSGRTAATPFRNRFRYAVSAPVG